MVRRVTKYDVCALGEEEEGGEGGGGREVQSYVKRNVCVHIELVMYLVRVGGWDDGVTETLALIAHQQMNVALCICFLTTGKTVLKHSLLQKRSWEEGASTVHALVHTCAKM